MGKDYMERNLLISVRLEAKKKGNCLWRIMSHTHLDILL